jgi:hypothetical protein
VTKDEQINLLDAEETLSSTQSIMSLSTVASPATAPATTVPAIVAHPLEGRAANADEWEKERTALYQQLDEKVFTLDGWMNRSPSPLRSFPRMMRSTISLRHSNVSNLKSANKTKCSLNLARTTRISRPS